MSDYIRVIPRDFAEQRPGIDPRNYARDWRDRDGIAAYRSESRSVTRDLHDARALLAAVQWRSISDDDLAKATMRAFSGRLSWDGGKLDYCTGQYWPTEYRKAVCATLAAALWDYWREDAETAQDIRTKARRDSPAEIASRWFN